MASKLKLDVLETGSGSGTIALNNQLSGMTSASVPAGSVIQVVQGVATTRVTISSTSWTAVNTSASITPSSSSNKILIHLNFGVNDNTTGDVIAYTTVYRDSTNLGDSTSGFAKLRCTTSRIETMQSIMYLDSPATTAAITYSMYAKTGGSGAPEFPGATGMPTVITLTEIKG